LHLLAGAWTLGDPLRHIRALAAIEKDGLRKAVGLVALPPLTIEGTAAQAARLKAWERELPTNQIDAQATARGDDNIGFLRAVRILELEVKPFLAEVFQVILFDFVTARQVTKGKLWKVFN